VALSEDPLMKKENVTENTADTTRDIALPPTDGSAPPEPSKSPGKKRGVWGQGAELYKLLESEIQHRSSSSSAFWSSIIQFCDRVPGAAGYFSPKDMTTPLHLACQLIDNSDIGTAPEEQSTALDGVRALITACPEAVIRHDITGHSPLHYAFINPGILFPRNNIRIEVIKLITASDLELSMTYLSRNDINYGESGGRTALYHIIDSLDDDMSNDGASCEFVQSIHVLNPSMLGVRNASDGDCPLSLLYRRFVRQFDSSEKFFPGDNSRPEVVKHREAYKVAAMNSFRIIDQLLRPTGDNGATKNGQFRLVHNASKVDCPPDLFRYIVETHVDQVTEVEEVTGRLPLHIAAMAGSTQKGAGVEMAKAQSPHSAYHSKFVIDELLYAYRDGAAVQDAEGNYPLVLAIHSGKKWIDGGLKSLYEAFPDATHQIDTDNIRASLKPAFSFTSNFDDGADDDESGGFIGEEAPRASEAQIKRDNHHDSIMLVQKDETSTWDIVGAMWANEEDAGVQMLGCISIEKRVTEGGGEATIIPAAVSGVTAIVNAMKNHPNEPAVQERACSALLALSPSDGKREVSFAASGAVASIVSAMQAHVSDAAVQEMACCALRKIVAQGGAERATVVASVSGFTAIVNAMGAHPGEGAVQKEACKALEVMTGFPDANLPDLPGMQTAPLLQMAKEKFPYCREAVDVVLTRLS